MADLISIKTAAERGIARLRELQWTNKLDYLRIDIINGEPGPWVHLYSPTNEIIGQKNPQSFIWALFSDGSEACFEPYEGEIDPVDRSPLPAPPAKPETPGREAMASNKRGGFSSVKVSGGGSAPPAGRPPYPSPHRTRKRVMSPQEIVERCALLLEREADKFRHQVHSAGILTWDDATQPAAIKDAITLEYAADQLRHENATLIGNTPQS